MIELFFKLKIILSRLKLRLFLIGLDIKPWHLSGTYESRIYKQFIVKKLNSMHFDCVLDIGCGLGDIVSRVNVDSKYKIGFDIDKRLKKAIKRIYNGKFNFFYDREELNRYIDKCGIRDLNNKVVIMVGFIYKLDESEAYNLIKNYIENLGSCILVIDITDDSDRSFKAFLNRQTGIISELKIHDRVNRKIFFIDLINKKLRN